MIRKTLTAAVVAVAAVATLPGCAVFRGQQSTQSYVSDTAITTKVKARFVENKQVDASAISVETLNGEVMLSGFAKNATERAEAERIARATEGVRSVNNKIAVR